MAYRKRETNDLIPRGTAYRFGDTFGGGSILGHRKVTEDYTGPGDCDPFTVNQYTKTGGVITSNDDGYWQPYFKDYIADAIVSHDVPHLSPLGVPSNTVAATKAAARTNPSRPYVDIPVALLELGDIVQLVRDSGRSLARQLASANIKHQFGIAPIASDLAKLYYFQDQLNRRIKEVKRLAGKRGLRRTVTIGTYDAEQVVDTFLQSQLTTIRKNVRGHTAVTVKAHVRWKASAITLSESPEAMRALIKRALLGLTVDFSTLWEAVPWTWLIDWGSTVGSFLQASRNIIPAQLMSVHVMRHTKTSYRCPGHEDGDIKMTPVFMTRETKTRVPASIAPTAQFPFLSGSQMGILGSLSVLRRR